MRQFPNPITIVGCGPGSLSYVPPVALQAIKEADVLVGAKRLLDLFPWSPAGRVEVDAGLESVLREIELRSDGHRVAVLVTGDPGLFSLARLVIRRFGRDRCVVIPGISSVQIAFARLGLDWADARIISAHKEDPELEESLLDADKIAILGGRERAIRWIAEALAAEADTDRRVFVLENLTLPDERIREVRGEDLAVLEVDSRSIIMIIKRSVLS